MADPLFGIVPILGSFEFNQKNSNDDYLAFKDTGGTTRMKVTKLGHLNLRSYTTKPTTGMTKNDLFLIYHGSTPKLSLCTSTAGQTIKMVRAKTKTVGRLTA